MAVNRSFLRFSLYILALWLALPAKARPVDLDVPMSAPPLDGFNVVFPAIGGDVVVDLKLRYDEKGKVVSGGSSTVDGSPVEVKGTMKGQAGGWGYRLKLKDPVAKGNVQVAGEARSGRAALKYKGPKGKVALGDVPATFTASNPVTSRISLSPQVDAKGKLTGTGTVQSGFGNDTGVVGVLKGKLKGDSLSWSLSCGRQKASFKGVRSGDSFLGTLKVKFPPEKGVRTDFLMPDVFEPPVTMLELTDNGGETIGSLAVSRKGAIFDLTTCGQLLSATYDDVVGDIPPLEIGTWLVLDYVVVSQQDLSIKPVLVIFGVDEVQPPMFGYWAVLTLNGHLLCTESSGVWSE